MGKGIEHRPEKSLCTVSNLNTCTMYSDFILIHRTQLKQSGGLHIKGFGILGGLVETFLQGFAKKGGMKVSEVL